MSTPVYYRNAAPARACAQPCYVMLVPGCGMVQCTLVPFMAGAHVCGSGAFGQGGGIQPVERILDVVSGAYERLKQYPDWKQLLDSYVTHAKGNEVWRSMFQFPETWPADYSNWFNHLGRRETESLLTQALRWSSKYRPDSGAAAALAADSDRAHVYGSGALGQGGGMQLKILDMESLNPPQNYLNLTINRIQFLPHELNVNFPSTKPGYYQFDQFPDLLNGLRAEGVFTRRDFLKYNVYSKNSPFNCDQQHMLWKMQFSVKHHYTQLINEMTRHAENRLNDQR